MNLLIYSTDTELFSISPYRSPLFFETPGTGLYVYGRVVPKSPIRLSKRLPLPHVSKLTKHNGRSVLFQGRDTIQTAVLRVSFLRSEWDQVRHNVVTAVRTESEVS